MTNDGAVNGFPVNSENEYFDINQGARARAINPLADALQAAGLGGPAAMRPMAQGVEAMPISTALASCEQPAGELLTACQVQRDAQLVERCIGKLAGKMLGAGRVVQRPILVTISGGKKSNWRREVGGHDWRDARGAGLLALTAWRHTGAGVDGLPEVSAARVAWRAVVNALSRDAFGESTDSLDAIQDDWLWHNAAQHDESPKERAIARLVSMQSANRKFRLGKRMAAMPAGRGTRAAVIEKVARAAESLLDGASLDNAASVAGFNACERSRNSASDALVKACKRLGLVSKTGNGGQQFTARMSTREDDERRGAFVPMVNAARSIGGQFAVTWDSGLIAVSGEDGCIEWTVPAFSNSPGHADEVLRELAKQHAAIDDICEQVESATIAPFTPVLPGRAATHDEPVTPSPTAGTVTVYPASVRDTRGGVVYVTRAAAAHVVN